MATWTKMRNSYDGANVKYAPLDWQLAGRSWTATGYGDRIPTRYMVWNGQRWQRVYCRIFSNVGTTYTISKGTRTVAEVDTTHADSLR